MRKRKEKLVKEIGENVILTKKNVTMISFSFVFLMETVLFEIK